MLGGISAEALSKKPKKPMNAYFKFRAAKIEKLKDEPDKTALMKAAWEGLSPETKAQMEATYKMELEQYKTDMEKWLQDNNLNNGEFNQRDYRRARQQKQKQEQNITREKEQENIEYGNLNEATMEELRTVKYLLANERKTCRELMDQIERKNELIANLQKQNEQLRAERKAG